MRSADVKVRRVPGCEGPVVMAQTGSGRQRARDIKQRAPEPLCDSSVGVHIRRGYLLPDALGLADVDPSGERERPRPTAGAQGVQKCKNTTRSVAAPARPARLPDSRMALTLFWTARSDFQLIYVRLIFQVSFAMLRNTREQKRKMPSQRKFASTDHSTVYFDLTQEPRIKPRCSLWTVLRTA